MFDDFFATADVAVHLSDLLGDVQFIHKDLGTLISDGEGTRIHAKYSLLKQCKDGVKKYEDLETSDTAPLESGHIQLQQDKLTVRMVDEAKEPSVELDDDDDENAEGMQTAKLHRSKAEGLNVQEPVDTDLMAKLTIEEEDEDDDDDELDI